MQVIKCINNNVVSCRDGKGHEMIAMGRGLGFALRPGDEVDEEKVEKLFRMQTPDDARRLTDLFSTLPPRQIELCSLIVDRATRDLGRKLSPSVYLTLTDHICFAIDRMRSGTTFQNTLLAEVRTFTPGSTRWANTRWSCWPRNWTCISPMTRPPTSRCIW